jgi:hypothetical protein
MANKGTLILVGLLTLLFFVEVVLSGDLYASNPPVSSNGSNEITGLLVCSVLGCVFGGLFIALNWHAVFGKEATK